MKKLFTLVALLTCFMGAKAEVEKVYSIDYSAYKGFPFYVMGYVPEWIDGVMTDFGADYRYETQENLDGDGDGKWKDGESSVGTATTNNGTVYQKVTGAGPYWHQYMVASDVPMELDETYTVKITIKASEAVNVNTQFGNWGKLIEIPVAIPASEDFQEVEWEVTGCQHSGGGFICIQPGISTATIELKKLEVYHDKGDVVPVTWLQMLTDNGNPAEPEGDGKYMGNAETPWPAWSLETTDGINANWRTDKAGLICAWSLTMGRNFDDQCADFGQAADRARPYPTDIEVEAGNESNHVYAVHVDQINCIDDCDGDGASIAWSNQFWIQSPKTWKTGTKIRIKFRYKAQHACNVGTQIHKENPSVYLHWNAVGDVAFTTEWQEFDKTIEFDASQGGGASLAFNLCSDADNGRTPNVFYFDDLSWEVLKLDEGLFVAAKGNDFNYDYAQATQFEFSESDDAWVATVGKKGKPETWANEVQISTVRGDKSAFLGATLKPSGSVTLDAEGKSEWLDFTESSQAKIKLPALGVYKIYVALEDKQMQFEQIEGEAAAEPVDIVAYTDEIVIDAVERQPTSGEEEGGTGATWDNQFFLYSNRDLAPGEVTILEFDYKAAKPANSNCAFQGVVEGNPDYITGAFDLKDADAFDAEWKSIKKELTMPAKKWDGKAVDVVKYLTFDLAFIKEANTYTFKNIKWYMKDDNNEGGKTLENLINADGEGNFAIKVGAGTNPVLVGIENVVFEKKGSAVIYNLAGQRVSNDFKGIVVKNGKKVVLK